MHVNPKSGKTVFTEQDVEVVERFAHLTRAMAFQFSPGSANPDEVLSKAAEACKISTEALVPLVKARYEADKPKPKPKNAAAVAAATNASSPKKGDKA